VYIVDGIEYSFAGISIFTFTEDIEVIVEKRERADGTDIILVYWEGMEVIVTIDTSSPDWQMNLPELERVGYNFLGWAEYAGKMFAQWQLLDAGYIEPFVGEWYCKIVAEITAA
jgi:hypothetical protein